MSRDRKRPHIIVIDDDEPTCRMLTSLLVSEGYDVTSAAGGDEGIASALGISPDVILLDYEMPGLDGIQTCSRLKAGPATSDIPVIMMTGHQEQDVKLASLEAGAVEFLLKPVDHIELNLRIKNILAYRGLVKAGEKNQNLVEAARIASKARQEWEDTFDSLEDIITIHDRDYNIIRANKKAKEVLKLPQQLGPGIKCYKHYHNTDEPPEQCPAHRCMKQGIATTAELFEPHLGRYIEVKITPRLDLSGHVTGYIHIVRDLTEAKRTENQLQRFIDSSQDMVFRTDKTGTFTMINKAGAEILGYKDVSEVMGKKASDFWQSSEDRMQMIEKLRNEKMVKSYHIPARKIDGTPVEMEATSRVVEDEEGNFAGIEGIIRDVTARNNHERELQNEKKALQLKHEELNNLFNKVESIKREWESSFDATGDMIIIIDSEGLIKRCNRTFMEFAGRNYEGLLLKDWDSVVDEIGLRLHVMYQGSSELSHEKSGRWFQLISHNLADIENRMGSIITIHDTTEMKNISEALAVTNSQIEEDRCKLQYALDEISGLIERVTFNKDFSVRFANPNLRKCHDVMNCTRTSCLCYGKDAERCWQIAGTYCGGKVQGEFAEKFGNCAVCPTFQFATSDPIYQIGESFNNMMHILERQHAEIERAYGELKMAQSQITQQEKMASIGQLAAGVAHEINNPTGFIMSNLGSFQKYVDRLTEFIGVQAEALSHLPAELTEEILKKRKALKVDFITEDIKSLVTESLDGADRIKKIVQDLKSFSRVDEAEQKMADLNAGIESTINIVWNELKYKVTLHKEYGAIPQIKCNPGQLNQVFMNMLVNAAHAIEKQGDITVKTWFIPPSGREDHGIICISIADTGSGIPADKLNRIFEPFYTTKEVGKGTGLGLSIAYDIIKKHKGEIAVESEPGKGTTFIVRIPVVEDGT